MAERVIIMSQDEYDDVLHGLEVNRDTFNEGIHEYIGNGAVAVHVGALYDLRHPDEVDD